MALLDENTMFAQALYEKIQTPEGTAKACCYAAAYLKDVMKWGVRGRTETLLGVCEILYAAAKHLGPEATALGLAGDSGMFSEVDEEEDEDEWVRERRELFEKVLESQKRILDYEAQALRAENELTRARNLLDNERAILERSKEEFNKVMGVQKNTDDSARST